MSGKPVPPKPLPDRMFTIAKRFMDRYPRAQEIVADFRAVIEDECAWVEFNSDAHSMTISMWYGPDRKAAEDAIAPLAASLAEWDRHQ